MTKSTSKYPIYIPSKNRSESSLTANFMIKDGVDFKIVIEPQEYKKYREYFKEDYLLQLPKNNQGLIYARKWIRKHSEQLGYERHWQFDDNIGSIKRLHKGHRIICNAGWAIKVVEDFTDRYENIGMSGFNYTFFAMDNVRHPIYWNTHLYSGFLFNNKMPYTWDLEWNDDVDINLQVLSGGTYCIAAFNALSIDKRGTMTSPGGLTTEYKKTNTRKDGAIMLAKKWPAYVKVVEKYGRWHFTVKNDWKMFKQKPIRKKSIDWDMIKTQEYKIKLRVAGEIKKGKMMEFAKLYKDKDM